MEPDSSGGDTGGSEPSESLIFVSDASAEAERLTASLRARGYVVVDVPLGLLLSRVGAQRPAIVLCDADAPNALEIIERMREVSGGTKVDVLFFGDASRVLDQEPERAARQSSGTFIRPVDTYALLRKVEGLIGPPRGGGIRQSSLLGNRAPVLVAATRRPYRYDKRARLPNLPASRYATPTAAINRHSSPDGEMFPGSLPTDLIGRSASAELRGISPDVQALLGQAEQRVLESRSFQLGGERLSPEAELEAVLPKDLLAALDEPLDELDELDEEVGTPGTHGSDASHTGRGSSSSRSGQDSKVGTSPGGAANPFAPREPITSSGDRAAEIEPPSRESAPVNQSVPVSPSADAPSTRAGLEAPEVAKAAPGRASLGRSPAEGASNHPTQAEGVNEALDLERRNTEGPDPPKQISTKPPRGRNAPSVTVERPDPIPSEPADVEIPNTLHGGDALRVLARAVRVRYSGAIAFEDDAGIRRVVLRDGDFVIAAAGIDSESLTAFLAQRGDLSGDVAMRLGRKLPQFGRHAGAALIAQGHLRQEDLWPVLRAHAEWLITHIATLDRAAAGLERVVPPRLSSEPSVFGGATGAEVLIEVARRAVPPNDALVWIGGPNTVLLPGDREALLAECALGETELDLVRSASGVSVAELLERSGSQELATLLFTLVELGVLRTRTSGRKPQNTRRHSPPDVIDHDAVRARVRARRALVDEGDYFALLGVSRNATGYDVRRAYTTLRQNFEPSQILTPLTVDLQGDVEMIVEVLDEAYEILRDSVRRERYRRALEEAPESEARTP